MLAQCIGKDLSSFRSICCLACMVIGKLPGETLIKQMPEGFIPETYMTITVCNTEKANGMTRV